MKKLSARRRHPLAALVVLLFALAATGGLYAAFAPAKPAQAEGAATALSDIEEGKKLYLSGCSSCHGLNGQGSSDGPSLVGVGAAAVDFQVMTGRMPMQQQGPQAPRKPVVFTQEQSDQLGAFIASLGAGPAVPREEDYALEEGNNAMIAEGGELFRTNCSQCHNFAGEGGALPDGKFAPSLVDVDPKHIYEAMLTGPQNMPSFPDTIMPPEQKKAIVTYITGVTKDEPNPGGLGLGRLGPVSEGLFVWIFGLGFLIAAAIWIAARTPKARTK
ncbi:cytochrome bc1 complex diheme cytochrome c subunit [Yinghuangia soli]|uniref:Cytochrome bc1 complex cytochrome c subunit n=1 Tax=Yinghuangia soli TaxID=2908204 RepID=A0AA41U6R2_9ACTN|nr:c-type cytochrome [Yinghuangia soli]MCF2531224.1 c-type cytochrome [Yinghuangia soli]